MQLRATVGEGEAFKVSSQTLNHPAFVSEESLASAPVLKASTEPVPFYGAGESWAGGSVLAPAAATAPAAPAPEGAKCDSARSVPNSPPPPGLLSS